MRAVIKRMFSTDVEFDSYKPSDPRNFSFLLRLMVGPADSEGEESFDVEVCTPAWLSQKYGKDDVIMGRHFLFVVEYNRERIIRYVTDFVSSCSGETWVEVAQKISRLGRWEFEDNREYEKTQEE